MGSSPGRSFLALENSLFVWFGQGGLRNVRLAALNLRKISGMDLGGLRPESGISGNLRFSPKFMGFLTFTLMSPSV